MTETLEIGDLLLENGQTLNSVQVAYRIYGTPATAEKVIWVCHALTANAEAQDWWPGMIGEGEIFDTRKFAVVCANILGSCYGTRFDFAGEGQPLITIRDMVSAHQKLASHLGIQSVDLLCGGSLGGMQCLEWSIIQPDFVKNLFVIATNSRHSSWGIAFNEAQRMALELGERGLDAARAIAMLSYRHYRTYEATQQDEPHAVDGFAAASYQRYQGEKLRKRFTPEAYYLLSKAMDSHNVGRSRSTVEEALARIKAKTLVVGIDSDLLFPLHEQEFLAAHIPGAVFEKISSAYGHDGFLLETHQIKHVLRKHVEFL